MFSPEGAELRNYIVCAPCLELSSKLCVFNLNLTYSFFQARSLGTRHGTKVPGSRSEKSEHRTQNINGGCPRSI